MRVYACNCVSFLFLLLFYLFFNCKEFTLVNCKKNTLELHCRRFLQSAGSSHFVLLLSFRIPFSLFVGLLDFYCGAARAAFIVFPLIRFWSLDFLCSRSTRFQLSFTHGLRCSQWSPLSLSLALPKRVSSGGSVKSRVGDASGRMSHHSAPVCDVNGNDSFRTGPTVQQFNVTTTATWPKLSTAVAMELRLWLRMALSTATRNT